ncbi:LysR family transcriptional regulator [Caldimonas brevitalea]|uniref:LysR family transcriptional regulator n=1 Tax=Caldimonas brevitalea TaxID=413882 RepID=A0A0G3BN51_9BURK|nr:LysR substrate-binding domain-containing protein [Caldimonas brevitalea]AKJ29418.1 LysR family transcriptional regulator [Caldimonas brevitalea]
MDLNALADFHLVATHGGFGRASRASHRSKATLSRRIAELEEQLGVRLIERGVRGLELTEAGQSLLSRTEGPMHEVADAVAAAREGAARPRGRLRVAAPLLFSQLALGRLCAEFRARYPEVEVEVVAEDRVVDLVEERFDLAIRPNPHADTALVGRCFAQDRLVAAAAPSIPMPTSDGGTVPVPAAVMNHRQGETWVIDGGRLTIEPVPVLRLSSLLMLRDAVIAGAGVALLPQSIIWHQLARGELVQWGRVDGKEVELWVLHTSRRLASPKVSAFVEFICARYADGPLVLAG